MRNPWIRSAFRSSKSSMPTETRTGGRDAASELGPRRALCTNDDDVPRHGCAPGSETRRCSIRDSTPPSDVAGVKSTSWCASWVAYDSFARRIANVAGPDDICFPGCASTSAETSELSIKNGLLPAPIHLVPSPSCSEVCQTCSTTPPGPSRSLPG